MTIHTTDQRSRAAPAPWPPPVADALRVRPPWSVQSLERLLAAIRETARTAPPRKAEQLARRRRAADQACLARAAAAQQAWNDRYHNAWENT
jgi:hypothetical protein